jgi:hypothetical protein
MVPAIIVSVLYSYSAEVRALTLDATLTSRRYSLTRPSQA